MAQYELLLPKMGESVAEATVIKWLKQPGDMISLDDTLLEIATDKVDSEVPSPVAGKLIKQLFGEDEVVQVGAVIAWIEVEGEEQGPIDEGGRSAVITPAADVAEMPEITAAPTADTEGQIPGTALLEAAENIVVPEVADTDRFYSPLVRSIAAQERISAAELHTIAGSGAEGRLTKDDLLNYIQTGRKGTASVPAEQPYQALPPMAKSQDSPVNTAHKSTIVSPVLSMSGADEIIEMDRMGKIIADHMTMSKHTSAHVTSFVEADVTNLVLWREKIKKNFEKRENEKITFTPIFIEAVAKAIKDFPMINVSVNGTQIIKRKDINIGMAAALPTGNLIVPVIKNADQLNLVGLTKSVNDLAVRARAAKLKPDETQNGTFTLTNVGSFGNVMGTPIINQPQVAILAVGTIKKKPAVLETEYGDVIAIRHMMFLSLSYDHRVVNGALGGTFVRRVADYLENWDLNREI
ncbi:dihydrolipoamide acetyltransferase family protein [Pedobacter sp. AW31-3R]|uniref:dihydrolipoamide acetyltransferase family protein n=1 Tax=Pedobacter sp. AW31-3R TaxID=3445781 RepID=UPI003FA190E6